MPMSRDVIVWSSCVLLAYNLGSFEVPYILGSLNGVTLSSGLYSLYINPDITKIPETMAMTIILFLVGGILVAGYSRVLYYCLRGYRK